MARIYAPTSLLRGVRGEFVVQASNAPSFKDRLYTMLDSDGDLETYAWLGDSPAMRQIGEDDNVIFDGMSDTSYALRNQLWRNGVRISRRHFDDAQNNTIRQRIRQLASVGVMQPDILAIAAVIANGVCYDGANFFSNSHPIRGQQTATSDNIYTGTGDSVAQVQADLFGAIEQMMGLLAENGQPFHFGAVRPRFQILAPVGLRAQIYQAISPGVVSNTTNIVEKLGLFNEPIFDPRLTDANDWYLFRVDVPVLPIVIQERDPLEVQEEIKNFGEEYLYSGRWRGVAGYAHWQNAMQISNS